MVVLGKELKSSHNKNTPHGPQLQSFVCRSPDEMMRAVMWSVVVSIFVCGASEDKKLWSAVGHWKTEFGNRVEVTKDSVHVSVTFTTKDGSTGRHSHDETWLSINHELREPAQCAVSDYKPSILATVRKVWTEGTCDPKCQNMLHHILETQLHTFCILQPHLQNRQLGDQLHSGRSAFTVAEASTLIEMFGNTRLRKIHKVLLMFLEELRIDLRSKAVMTLGAGIGVLSQHFVDRGCSVLATDGKPRPKSDSMYFSL